MSDEEFLEQLYSEEDLPTDPDELLAFATHLYNFYLNAPADSPMHEINETDWAALGALVKEAKEADEEVKRLEKEEKEAAENYKKILRSFLSEN